MKSTPSIAPYGSWKSPVTSEHLAGSSIGMDQVRVEGDTVYWLESRPAEKGRLALMELRHGKITELTAAPYSVRSRVHEYGGGAYTTHGNFLIFSHFGDHGVYLQEKGGTARLLTKAEKTRFADFSVDESRQCVIAIGQNHQKSDLAPNNSIVALSLKDGSLKTMVEGNDFYASPRISPDGKRMAWFTWNHPNMPWDGTELWVGELTDSGTLKEASRVAGGATESITQVEWSPQGTLYYVSDRTGWWNLYRWDGGRGRNVCEMQAEFGRPFWVFGLSSFDFVDEKEMFCTFVVRGQWRLGLLNLQTGELSDLNSPYTEIKNLKVRGGNAVFLAGAPHLPWSLVEYDRREKRFRVLQAPTHLDVGSEYFSLPEPIEFPTDNRLTAHAFYYAPVNPNFQGPAGEKPPLIVLGHGGPTSACQTVLSLAIQFWTSRGFAVVDVNYGGSTGYGRPYRDRLKGQWGIVDVNDCVNAAKFLVGQSKADPNRLAVRGGSAGGYITLCAMTFHNVFRAGASYFGISDIEALVKDGHKFESRYEESLIGPYPEKKDLYRERSPIHFAEKVAQPLILFQGSDDKVVPPNQSQVFFEAVKKKGIPVAYIEFEGEDHGFRKKENIQRSLEAELYFYSRIFNFNTSDTLPKVPIENLS